MIKKIGSRFQLYNRDGTRALGPVTTKTKAETQERAIRIAKARAAGHVIPKKPAKKR